VNVSAPSPEVSPPPRWIYPRALAVFALAFAYMYRMQHLTRTIQEYDGWFHIKFASLLPTIGFTNEFKWAAQSTWATHFADKEFLFHVFLIPFTWTGDLIGGLKLATALLAAGVVVTFFLVLALGRARWPEAWTLLLLGSGYVFLYRLCMPRPHLLSIILLLWSVHLILGRRRRLLAVVILVYSLSYTAFHLPLALAVIVSVERWLVERELDWRTPATIAGAMGLGIVLHPYFPQSFLAFWAHDFVVPWMSVRTDLDLSMADELMPLSTRALLLEHMPIALSYLGAIYLALSRPRPSSRSTRALFLISSLYLLMTLMIHRFVEYSVPVTLWFLASFYSEQLAGFDLRRSLARGAGRSPWIVRAATAATALLLAGSVVKTYRDTAPIMNENPPSLRGSARWLAEHTEPDELVFTCDWDDSPQLFFYDDHNRYPVMMDPVLMYLHDPQLWREWSRIADGGFAGRTYDMLVKTYRHGVCTWDFEAFRHIVETDPRFTIVHDDVDAFVFSIDPEKRAISLDQFLDLAPPKK
jgi:hypothetical protein